MTQHLYLVALVCINAFFLVQALSNIVYFRRATAKPRIRCGPFVSVIVPARNEERSIARCLESLLAQDYADFEVVVVDDQSSDATPEIIAALGADNPRLRLVSGTPPPSGWLGKPHALSEGVAVACGEILLLTDADTVHTPQSISWSVTNLSDHRVDMLSGYVEQEYGSLGETMIVPTMYAAMLLVPFYLLSRSKSPRLAFAIGQYVAYRRKALDGVGGFEAIRDSIVDDMAMATRMKEFGYRGVFLDATAAASCRLYRGYREAFVGIRRSTYSALGGNPLTAIVVSALALGVIVVPAFSALMSNAQLQMPTLPVAVSVALFATQWGLVAWDRDAPFTAFVLYPLVFLNLVIILNASMLGTGFGRGVDWKGRTVRGPRRSGVEGDSRVADFANRSDKGR